VKDRVLKAVTYVLVLVSALGAVVLLPETMDDRRFEDDEEPSRLRTVLTRVRTLAIPFSFFSSLGTEAPPGADELMVTVGLVTRFRE
jgi:hypothetical protein